MKQLFFLLLFPCLAMAQYQGNGNQKISLGEQTTADGLVYRGIRADTASKIVPFSDTSAYIILDTVEKTLWLYKAGQVPKWQQVGGSAGGVTSVAALTLGTTGTDLSSTVANSTTTPVITLNVPDASATARGVITTGTQTFGGTKTFSQFNVNNASNAQILINTNGNLGASGAYFAFQRNSGTRWVYGMGQLNATNDYEINPKGVFGAFVIKDSTGESIFSTIPTSGTYPYGTERMRITSTGNVGIGTTGPDGKLTINTLSASLDPGTQTLGTISFGEHTSGMPSISGKADTNKSGLWIGSATDDNNSQADLRFGIRKNTNSDFTNFTSRAFDFTRWATSLMTILRNGNVGIGTSSPAVQFHTTSNVRFAGLASITDLRTNADGDLFNGSDFNLKNSIDTINFGLSDVLKLKPVSFNWNDEARNINEYKSMGFIAQDVMDVIPNAASTMGDGDMQVDYNAIVATLTKAIQEQQALIKALEQRILTLENK